MFLIRCCYFKRFKLFFILIKGIDGFFEYFGSTPVDEVLCIVIDFPLPHYH